MCVSRGDNVCRAAVHFFPSFSGANERVKEECSDNWLVSASRPKRDKKKRFGLKETKEGALWP